MQKTILIVEDNVLNMKLVTDLLRSYGYDIRQSFDGKNTLQLARNVTPNLIIMDINLPAVSGLEHIKMLKADDGLKGIPILVVTAYVMEGDSEMCFEAGCDHYMSKPISISNFTDVVNELTM